MGQELPGAGRLSCDLQQQEGGSLFPSVPIQVPKRQTAQEEDHGLARKPDPWVTAKATKRKQQVTVIADSHGAFSAAARLAVLKVQLFASGPNPECCSGTLTAHLAIANIIYCPPTWPQRCCQVIFSRPELTTGAQRQWWMTPGVNVINNRAQVLIQGEGFPRANKHPVESTSDYMAAGRTSALTILRSFEKQSAWERQDVFGNANNLCQWACLTLRSSN